jgi:hypothetical protein
LSGVWPGFWTKRSRKICGSGQPIIIDTPNNRDSHHGVLCATCHYRELHRSRANAAWPKPWHQELRKGSSDSNQKINIRFISSTAKNSQQHTKIIINLQPKMGRFSTNAKTAKKGG